jgi:hypothetical protein
MAAVFTASSSATSSASSFTIYTTPNLSLSTSVQSGGDFVFSVPAPVPLDVSSATLTATLTGLISERGIRGTMPRRTSGGALHSHGSLTKHRQGTGTQEKQGRTAQATSGKVS